MIVKEETLIDDLACMAGDLSSTQLRNLYQSCLYDGDIELCEIIKIIMMIRDERL